MDNWIIEEDKTFLEVINLTPEKVEELISSGCWEAASYGRNLGLVDQIAGFRFGGLDREVVNIVARNRENTQALGLITRDNKYILGYAKFNPKGWDKFQLTTFLRGETGWWFILPGLDPVKVESLFTTKEMWDDYWEKQPDMAPSFWLRDKELERKRKNKNK